MAMRGCLFAIQEGNLPEYAKNVFMSYWSKGLDISNLTILLDIATSSDMDPEEFEDFIKSSEAKNTLIFNTDELIDRGGLAHLRFFIIITCFLVMIDLLYSKTFWQESYLKFNIDYNFLF